MHFYEEIEVSYFQAFATDLYRKLHIFTNMSHDQSSGEAYFLLE